MVVPRRSGLVRRSVPHAGDAIPAATGDARGDRDGDNDDVIGRGVVPSVTVMLCVAAIVEVATTARPSETFALFIILAVATTAPVAVAAVQPALAAATIATAGVVATFSGLRPPAAALLSLCATVYLAVLRGSGRSVVLLGLALAVLGSAVSTFRVTVAVAAIAVVVAATAGAVRRSHAVAAAHDASSRVLSDTLLENHARGERARIARELHDVVAHHISLIALQADTVRLTTLGLPADGVSGLVTIADSARTALTEMRRLLGVLRDDTAEEPDRRPQPSLHQLNELVDATRAAGGMAARLIVRGSVRPLSPVLELTAYRIVQEALSNSRRHAQGAAIDVDVRYDADALRMRVRDNGPAATRTDGVAGHGLTGMRERAAMIGGTVAAGPAYPVGFLVEAVLPVEDRP